VLAAIFTAMGFPADHILHLALGTAMAATVPTAIASVRAHHARGAVLWPVVGKIAPAVVLGAFAATFVAAALPTTGLAIFFTLFMGYVALQLWLDVKPKPKRELPGPAGLGFVGLLIGAVSALVAIGGGSLSVAFMTWCNVDIRSAIATSAGIGLPLALAGAAGYVANGVALDGLPAQTLGFVYWPAALAIAGVSIFTARVGAALTHTLPLALLKKLFALLLIGLSLKMLHSVL